MNTTAARHTPHRQEAGAHRPDVVPSFFGLFRKTRNFGYAEQPVTITSCSFCNSRQGWAAESHQHRAVRFADGPEICRYRHVICGVADKSRVSRNCRAKRTAHGQNPAMMAGQRLRFPARGKERAAVRDPVKDGDWAFGWPQVRDDMMAVTGTVPDVRRGHYRCRRVGQVSGQQEDVGPDVGLRQDVTPIGKSSASAPTGRPCGC